ncbi:membrane protein [Geobacillus stearothermophilus 10]|nr:membrane protein [Geobacillus stearothermophilus 10]
MRTVILALLISLTAHIVYFAATIGIGYWKTRLYKPNAANAWGRIDMLQNEVVFGQAGSSVVYLFSFVGVAVISALVLYVYKMARS